MNSNYSFSQLSELEAIYKAQSITTAFERRSDTFNELQETQQKNVLYARSYYLLIYNLFIDDKGLKTITHEDFMKDIFITNIDMIDSLDSLQAQVFLNTLKKINTEPKTFAKALIDSIPNLPISFFAFSTFPSIYGFFTSIELCSQASIFILDLIKLNAPDSLLYPIVLSFLFSLSPFVDALWTNFFLRASLKDNIFDEEIIVNLSRAINECAPLINSAVFNVINELLQKRHDLINFIITDSFIPLTYKLWCLHSNYAMGFAPGQNIMKTLSKLQSSPKAPMIAALFGIHTGRIETCPSYTTVCKVSSEILFFSHIDLKVFIEAFKSIADQIELFNVLEEASNELVAYRFLPFSVAFFLSDLHSSVESLHLSSRDMKLFDVPPFEIEEPETDMIYEEAQHRIMEDPSIKDSLPIFSSESFQMYTTIKNLLLYRETIEIQENLLTLKSQKIICDNFISSLLRMRRYAFSEYISKYIKTHKIDSVDVPNSTLRVLLENNDKQLYIQAFIEVVNCSSMNHFSVPNLQHQMFLSIIRSFIEINWKEAGEFGKKPYVFRIVPVLSKRKDLRIGDYFYLIDQLLTDIRTISSYNTTKQKSEEIMTILIQTVFHSSNTPVLLDVFLYFEKVAFRDPKFLSSLLFLQNKNWNLFIQMMWKTLEKDINLIQQCMILDIFQLNEIMQNGPT